MKETIKKILREFSEKGEEDSMVIYYDDVSLWQPDNSNNKFLFFSDVSDYPKPTTTKIVLVDTKTDKHVAVDGDMVKISKGRGSRPDRLRIMITRQNDKTLEPIIPKDYEFSSIIKNKNYWRKSGQPYRKVTNQIQKSVEEMYKNNDFGVGHRWGKNPDDSSMVGVLDFEVAEGSEHWSIINFFNSNPVVRSILLKSYEDWLDDSNKEVVFDLDEFVDYIWLERDRLFNPNNNTFKRLAKANHMTWGFGRKNEDEASQFLKKLFGDKYETTSGGKAGTRGDVFTGVDLVVTRKQTGEKTTYQAKPLDKWYKTKKGLWVIKSSELKKYDKNVVKWFIFGPNKSNVSDNEPGEFLIFKNDGEVPESTDTIIFRKDPKVKKRL